MGTNKEIIERLKAVQCIVSAPCDKEEAECVYEEISSVLSILEKQKGVADGLKVKLVVSGYRHIESKLQEFFDETDIKEIISITPTNTPEGLMGLTTLYTSGGSES